jgi:endonuclease I
VGKERLCQFETVGDDSKVHVDVCIHCGRKVRYNKDKDGRIDNEKYLKDHKRDFLQRGGRTSKLFEQVYKKK